MAQRKKVLQGKKNDSTERERDSSPSIQRTVTWMSWRLPGTEVIGVMETS